jgi:hypothetical protein
MYMWGTEEHQDIREAEALARAEADRLNAKWRAERQEQQERERAEAKAKAIAAFVKRGANAWKRLVVGWGVYGGTTEVYENGSVQTGLSRSYGGHETSLAELESALIAAGVQRPVVLTDELRRQLWIRLFWCLKYQAPWDLPGQLWGTFFINPDGAAYQRKEGDDFMECTRAQVDAFMAELKSKMGVET